MLKEFWVTSIHDQMRLLYLSSAVRSIAFGFWYRYFHECFNLNKLGKFLWKVITNYLTFFLSNYHDHHNSIKNTTVVIIYWEWFITKICGRQFVSREEKKTHHSHPTGPGHVASGGEKNFSTQRPQYRRRAKRKRKRVARSGMYQYSKTAHLAEVGRFKFRGRISQGIVTPISDVNV